MPKRSMKIALTLLLTAISLPSNVLARDQPLPLDATVDAQFTPVLDRKKEAAVTVAQLQEILDVFEPIVARAAKSTVWVKSGKRRVALGTVVDAKGGVITKASELGDSDKSIRCQLADGTTIRARRERTWENYDLTLLRMERHDLPPAPLHRPAPVVGSLIATPMPGWPVSGVGVVSVQVRDLSENGKGYLGVSILQREDNIIIGSVNRPSAAANAGLRSGDVILSLDGKQEESVQAFVNRIAEEPPGEEVEIRYARNGREETVKVTLGNREEANELFNPLNPMDHMGGRTSAHRTGYPRAWQHDIGLQPELMGGPVVDLDGRVLGINVARAGRVKTYAIPSSVILDWLDEPDPAPPREEDLDHLLEKLRDAEAALRKAREALESARAQRGRAAPGDPE